jgi:hypothetical protein
MHCPSAQRDTFHEFDSFLLLARGGKTVYFDDIGQNYQTLLKHFESHGAGNCRPKENPAESMLDIVKRRTEGHGEDWHSVWRSSRERHIIASKIDRIDTEA